jgi:recombination protein RecA
MGDSHVGLQARLMSQALRKLAGVLSKSSTCMLFINQIRMKIGVMYGNPETTTGGNALKFYASLRLEVRKGAQVDIGDKHGSHIKVKIVKNKMAPPFKTAEFDLVFGEGIDWVGELLDVAVKTGVIKRSGSWYSYNDKKLGQGKEQTGLTLNEDPALLEEINTKVRNIAFGITTPPESEAGDG